MREDDMRGRVADADVARLATVRPDGRPHVVPVTFALDDGELVTAVDHKPKSTSDLQRLANIRHEPRVALLVDHYVDDWSRLWWVRVDGEARIVDGGRRYEQAVGALVDRYAAYREHRPAGPAIVIRPTGWRGWSAAP